MRRIPARRPWCSRTRRRSRAATNHHPPLLMLKPDAAVKLDNEVILRIHEAREGMRRPEIFQTDGSQPDALLGSWGLWRWVRCLVGRLEMRHECPPPDLSAGVIMG